VDVEAQGADGRGTRGIGCRGHVWRRRHGHAWWGGVGLVGRSVGLDPLGLGDGPMVYHSR
jgi:hypothetical protein